MENRFPNRILGGVTEAWGRFQIWRLMLQSVTEPFHAKPHVGIAGFSWPGRPFFCLISHRWPVSLRFKSLRSRGLGDSVWNGALHGFGCVHLFTVAWSQLTGKAAKLFSTVFLYFMVWLLSVPEFWTRPSSLCVCVCVCVCLCLPPWARRPHLMC